MSASIPTLVSLVAAGVALLCAALSIPQSRTRSSLAWTGSASGVLGIVAASAGFIRPLDLAAVAGVVLLGGVAEAGWTPRGKSALLALGTPGFAVIMLYARFQAFTQLFDLQAVLEGLTWGIARSSGFVAFLAATGAALLGARRPSVLPIGGLSARVYALHRALGIAAVTAMAVHLVALDGRLRRVHLGPNPVPALDLRIRALRDYLGLARHDLASPHGGRRRPETRLLPGGASYPPSPTSRLPSASPTACSPAATRAHRGLSASTTRLCSRWPGPCCAGSGAPQAPPVGNEGSGSRRIFHLHRTATPGRRRAPRTSPSDGSLITSLPGREHPRSLSRAKQLDLGGTETEERAFDRHEMVHVPADGWGMLEAFGSFLGVLLLLSLLALAARGAHRLIGLRSGGRVDPAESILRERFARREIPTSEYEETLRRRPPLAEGGATTTFAHGPRRYEEYVREAMNRLRLGRNAGSYPAETDSYGRGNRQPLR